MRRAWLRGVLAKAGSPRAAVRAMHAAGQHADRTAFLVGQLHAARIAGLRAVDRLEQVEFGVYSQWGEDGIIEFLVSRMEVPNRVFVEFGVEDYREANTRFLLQSRNWSGFVLDGSDAHVRTIRSGPLYVTHDLQAVAAFVTAENINSLIDQAGIRGDIGLLSIDVDGNDYWIWRAVEMISPRVVVCEYNSIFGDAHAITVPYDPAFDRRAAHYSTLFFGASLPALRELAAERGYVFVGCNTAGVNAFFVRADCAAPFSGLAQNAAFVGSRFRESRDRHGTRTFLRGAARQAEIADCVVVDLRRGQTVRIRDLSPPLL